MCECVIVRVVVAWVKFGDGLVLGLVLGYCVIVVYCLFVYVFVVVD